MANLFYRKYTSNIGNVATAVGGYTVGSNVGAIAIGISITNTTVNAVTANVSIYNGVRDIYLVKNAPILPNSTLIPVGGDQKIVMQPNDQLRVQSSSTYGLDVQMNIMETSGFGLTYDQSSNTWIYANAITFNTSLTSVLYDGTKFVAISGAVSPYGNVGATSTNGITWTQTSMVADTHLVTDFAYGGGVYVAPWYGSTNVATSSDGVTWTKQTNVIPDVGLSGGPAISTIAYGAGKFVALDQLGAVSYISTNGTTWSVGANVGGANTPGNLVSGFNVGIQYANGRFLAVNNSTYDGVTHNFFYSTDGVTWGNSAVTVTGSTWHYAYGNGNWVALPQTGATNLVTGMISANNGTTWSNISLVNPGQQFGGIIYDGQRFIGISSYNPPGIDTTGWANSISSIDGITWTTLAMPAGGRPGGTTINKTSAYGAGRVVILGGNNYGNAQVLYSA